MCEILGIEEVVKKESKFDQYFKEKGYEKEDEKENQKKTLISNVLYDVSYAIKFLGCSFVEAWNTDYLDLAEMIVHKMKEMKELEGGE